MEFLRNPWFSNFVREKISVQENIPVSLWIGINALRFMFGDDDILSYP